MRLDCDIVLDLLPLYEEGLLREGSAEQVEEHLETCPGCAAARKRIREPELAVRPEQLEPLRRARKELRRQTLTVASLTAFVTVAAGILIWGLFFLKPGDEMGYSLLNFYLLLPLAALVCSLLLGLREHWIKWLSPAIFGLFGWALPWAVFRATGLIFLCLAFLPALAGLLTGVLIRRIQARRR